MTQEQTQAQSFGEPLLADVEGLASFLDAKSAASMRVASEQAAKSEAKA